MRSAAREDLGTAADCFLTSIGIDVDGIDDDAQRARTYAGIVALFDRIDKIGSELNLIRRMLTPRK